jgi:hypothetical protein
MRVATNGRRGGKGYERIVEACVTIAIVLRRGESGSAHIATRMLTDPAFRADCISTARVQVANPAESQLPLDAAIAQRNDVEDAERLLRGVVGKVL